MKSLEVCSLWSCSSAILIPMHYSDLFSPLRHLRSIFFVLYLSDTATFRLILFVLLRYRISCTKSVRVSSIGIENVRGSKLLANITYLDFVDSLRSLEDSKAVALWLLGARIHHWEKKHISKSSQTLLEIFLIQPNFVKVQTLLISLSLTNDPLSLKNCGILPPAPPTPPVFFRIQ